LFVIQCRGMSQICHICLDRLNGPYLLQCGHAFCRICLEAYVQSRITDGVHEVKCFHPVNEGTCGVPLSDFEIHKLSTRNLWKKREKWRKRFLFKENGSECPYCDHIQEKYGSRSIQKCDACSKQYCAKHGRAHPIAMSCEEFESRDRKTHMTVQKTCTICPGCKEGVQKTDGCNKMKCSLCKTSFCFLCGSELKPPFYDHFDETSMKNIIWGCGGLLMYKDKPGRMMGLVRLKNLQKVIWKSKTIIWRLYSLPLAMSLLWFQIVTLRDAAFIAILLAPVFLTSFYTGILWMYAWHFLMDFLFIPYQVSNFAIFGFIINGLFDYVLYPWKESIKSFLAKRNLRVKLLVQNVSCVMNLWLLWELFFQILICSLSCSIIFGAGLSAFYYVFILLADGKKKNWLAKKLEAKVWFPIFTAVYVCFMAYYLPKVYDSDMSKLSVQKLFEFICNIPGWLYILGGCTQMLVWCLDPLNALWSVVNSVTWIGYIFTMGMSIIGHALSAFTVNSVKWIGYIFTMGTSIIRYFLAFVSYWMLCSFSPEICQSSIDVMSKVPQVNLHTVERKDVWAFINDPRWSFTIFWLLAIICFTITWVVKRRQLASSKRLKDKRGQRKTQYCCFPSRSKRRRRRHHG